MLELVVRRKDREIDRYVLPEGVTSIGRAESNSIILDDGSVSRKHARIVVSGGEAFFEDLGSGNGSYRGDVRINRVKIENGDRFELDPFTLEIHVRAATASAPETRPVEKKTSSSGHVILPPRTPGGSAAGGPRLVLADGSVSFLVVGEAIAIGRADDATISLSDPAVSRRHASLSRDGGRWLLRDEGSAHGTRLNGEPVESALLNDGDVVTVGDTELVFRDPPVNADVDDTQIPATNPVPLERTATGPDLEMEIEDEAPVARRPIALYAVASLAVALAILAFASQLPERDPKPKPLDHVQVLTLKTMETLAREGALASEEKAIDLALDRFARIITFAEATEMRGIPDAARLRDEAIAAIQTLREARVVAALREMNHRRALGDAETQKKIALLRSTAGEALADARRRKWLASYDRAVAALEKLAALGAAEAGELDQVRTERTALARQQHGAEIARLERDGKKRFDLARAKPRTAAGLLAAIREYDAIVAADARRLTDWPAKAEAEIAATRAELRRLAAPHKQAAAAAAVKQDWIEARSKLKTVIAIDSRDPATAAELARVQVECTKSAIAHLQQARVYEQAGDVKNARESIANVQRYAEPGSKEWRLAEDLKRKIARDSQ